MTQPRAIRSLATLALLKANYDAGRDHIEMFAPFVVDAVASINAQGFTLDQLAEAIFQRTGITIPRSTVDTLAGRLVRRKLLTRSGGEFRVTGSLPDPADLGERVARAVGEIGELARRLMEFAETRGLRLATKEGAVEMLLLFVGDNQPELLLNHFDADSASHPQGIDRTESRIIATFVAEVVLTNPTLRSILGHVLSGLVLRNALLLKDVSDAGRRFDQLRCYLDSNFLLGALGFAGQASSITFRESLDLLRATGARLEVFDRTVDEMKRILLVYETKLATAHERRTLYPTDITRHLVTSGATPADIREAIGLMEIQLRQLGVHVRPMPSRDRRFTLQESELAALLRKPGEADGTPRVQHDVDAVAAVLTIRAGVAATRLENAKAVFVTTSAGVVGSVRHWFETSGQYGAPPAVHQRMITNLAWLKRPAVIPDLLIHEVVALCAAALAPPRAVWESFLGHLSRLEASGAISDDEAAVVVASELTDRLLGEYDEEELAAQSTQQITERVLASYKSAAQGEVAEARGQAQNSEERRRQLDLLWRGRADRVAALGAWVCVLLCGSIIFGGIAVALPTVWDTIPSGFRPVAALAAFGAAVFAALSLVNGFNLKAFRLRLEAQFRTTLRAWCGATDAEPQLVGTERSPHI